MREPADEARALFEEHGAAVYRFASVLLRHRQDAEDVVQETFLKLLRHLNGGGTMSNVRGWLFTVAAHAARDRQRGAMRWIPWAAVHERSIPAPQLVDEHDDRFETARATMMRLAPRDRLLLGLRAQGLPYREIAAAAGIRPASVGRLLARAIDRWQRAANSRSLASGGGEKGEAFYEMSERRADSGHRR
jgi:RNA polymerase sigma-70 factor, ECF subfamily